MTTDEKKTELAQIAREIREFKGIEIAQVCTNAVPGEGSPDAQIMFAGEAPGFHEDQQGRPFVGQAGKLLEKVLMDVLGLRRQEVFITNVVKFRPPGNRDPFDNEIEACREWLDRQIAVIQPRIIVTLGRFSMGKFMPGVTISRVHGQPRFFDFSTINSRLSDYKPVIFPMYHPAAALRSGEMMRQFVEDFNKLKSFLTQPLPVEGESEKEDNDSSQLGLF